MIPKKIHYCWFGHQEFPQLVIKCIKSWSIYCPDYEIIEWNEDNFDINSNDYTKEAYNAKKYAFVSDYARLYALVNNGGIYMDTDVELIRPIDELLDLEAFCGFDEHIEFISTSIMACYKEYDLFMRFLSYYENRHFMLSNELLDLTTNVTIITNICCELGLITSNTRQMKNGLTVFPSYYFSPEKLRDGSFNIQTNTFCVHHKLASWWPRYKRIWKIIAIRIPLLQKINKIRKRLMKYF